MSETPQGPSSENLRRLSGMLPSFVKGMQEKALSGKGKETIGIVRVPKKCCKVCASTFDFHMVKPSQKVELESSICVDCQKRLDDKWIAFVCDNLYAFVKPTNNRFNDMEGQIVPISPHVMAEIGKTFHVSVKDKITGADTFGTN